MLRRGRGTTHVPIGAAGVLALLALVIAIGYFGPKRGSTDAVSAATPSATPSASGSVANVPTAVATPSRSPHPPTAEPTLAPGALFVGHPVWADWSPSGDTIAVLTSEAREPGGTTNVARFLTRSGEEIGRRVAADQLLWLDNGDYVAQQFDGASDPPIFTAFVGRVGVEDPLILLGQAQVRLVGRGARVAIVDVSMQGPSFQFSLWSPRGLLGPLDGMPLAFSPDGSRLAVAALPSQADQDQWNQAGAPAVATQIEVVDSSSGKVVASAPGASWPSGYAAFSPDGRYVAFGWSTGSLIMGGVASSRGQVNLLEIATGRDWQFEYAEDGYLQWSDKSHLTIWNESGTGPKTGFPVSVAFAQFKREGSYEAASSLGWRASWADYSSKLTVERSGRTWVVDMHGAIRTATWSPQGTELLVVWGSARQTAADDLSFVDTGQFVSILRP